MRIILTIFALILLTIPTFCAYCHGQPGEPHLNTQPIWSGKPKLIDKNKYGKLFEIGEGTNTMKLLHVYGNSYQMGLAHGTLLKK